MKQKIFQKSISDLCAGDKIWLDGEDTVEGHWSGVKEAKVLEPPVRVRTFGYQVEAEVDGKTVLTRDLYLHYKFTLSSLDNQYAVWVHLPNIEVGDQISWWIQTVSVEAIRQDEDGYSITVTDPLNGEKKEFWYSQTDALLVRLP